MIKSRGNHWFVFVEGGGCDNNVVVINICSRVPRRVAWSHSVKSTGWRLGVKSMSVYAVYNKLVLGAAGRSGVTRRCCCHPSQCQTPLKGCPSLVNARSSMCLLRWSSRQRNTTYTYNGQRWQWDINAKLETAIKHPTEPMTTIRAHKKTR